MNKRTVIRFMADVNQQSANALIGVTEDLIRKGTEDILLLISSLGGSVFHGISVYNFLKKAPINIETCNFGSVDSIATVIYCAGSKRYCVSNARFLIHSINATIKGDSRFEEKKLKEMISGLELDRENISKIIAENCKKEQKEIEEVMFEGTTYNPKEAKSFGLVHEITDHLFEKGDKIIGIG
jgi:ATP-dependent Clp protease, protease subunit